MLSTEQIKEGNKLIAEFMGFTKREGDNDQFKVPHGEDLKYSAFHLSITKMPYDQSWDWLMPVVERIESIGHYTHIFKDEDLHACIVWNQATSYNRMASDMIVPNEPGRFNKKIDAVWHAVVEFAKLHKVKSE